MEFIMLWLAFAILSAIIGGSKGRSAIGWLLLGIVFGVFALIAVIAMPAKTKMAAGGPQQSPASINVTPPRICANCRTANSPTFRYCSNCGAKL